jgi:hypothetical protein
MTGAGNPYVKLIYDKQKHKTQTLKHAEDVSWKEMFMLYVEHRSEGGLPDKSQHTFSCLLQACYLEEFVFIQLTIVFYMQ